MNIIFSSDNTYAPYLAVSIFSILKNNKDEIINFYVLDLGINQDNKSIIEKIVTHCNCHISFVPVNESDFFQFPKTIEYISLATYARLNLTNYIKGIDKAIYIDVDTLTNGSLKELWEINISNYYLAACQDAFIDIEHSSYKAKIGLSDKHVYFNAGVLLLNLDKWNKDNIFKKSIKWISHYYDLIEYQDQDILNGILKDKVKIINNRFNFTPSERALIRQKTKDKRQKTKDKRQKTKDKRQKTKLYHRNTIMPIIIYHYCGSKKFWHNDCYHTNSYITASLLTEIKLILDLPSTWLDSFEKPSLLTILKKRKKQLIDNIKYRIY